MSKPFIVFPDQGSAPLKIVGEQITVLPAGAQAGSAAEFFIQIAREVSPTAPDLGVLVETATSHRLHASVPAK